MFTEIFWHAFLRVNTPEKAQKLLRKFEEVGHTEVTLLSCKQYWKDDKLFEVGFTTPLNEPILSEAVLTALLAAHQLAYHWEVTGPYTNQENQWEFHGSNAKTKVTGIELINFRIESTN